MGVIQRAMVRSCPHVWFERAEMKDRHLVAKRLVPPTYHQGSVLCPFKLNVPRVWARENVFVFLGGRGGFSRIMVVIEKSFYIFLAADFAQIFHFKAAPELIRLEFQVL